ncbi:uncharacterized protein LOC143575637 [Bidens hawaiensis]|uniref:uncharacterized protein LOC143575637 n=1 Tax=Bidens hawaiensis TaxID=980011 RepID=UPI00404A5BBD
MDPKLHPAMTITNIRNFIPMVLEKESPHFTIWLELFQIHCRAYEVIQHLSPMPAEPASSSSSETTDADPKTALWSRLDALVLQWIYGTISTDLLHIICVPGQSAFEAWTALQKEFNDNSRTRAIFLGQEFANLNLANFSSMSAYLQHAELLAAQLQGLGSPIDNRMLVLQVLTGLTEQFDGISTVLQNRDPLLDFSEVRSRLTNEEAKKKRQSAAAAQLSATALAAVAASQPSTDAAASNRNRSRGPRRGRPRNNNNNRNRKPQASPNHPYIVFPTSWTANQWSQLMNNSSQQWSQPSSGRPPCPYPSRPNQQNSQGILGAHPDQANYSYTPTDIEQALYTMALNPPDHGVMDTGASSHSANQQGIYSPSKFNTCTNKFIIVGNGQSIPVVAQGNQVLPPPFPPLKLNNVLFAPHIIKNLISVRRLTTDNLDSIEFDPFGFVVKDLKTRAPILRCNSTGDLYPLTAPLHTTSNQPSAFTTITQDRWSDGTLERYKARLVCDGRGQQAGIDCGETFSPVVKPATIRLILSLALAQSWQINQLDVTNAFLHGTLHETVYMHQPMGFRDRDYPDHDRDIAYLLIYVDDIILTTSNEALRGRLMSSLAGEFSMKDLGPLSYFLGIQVTRTGNNLFLLQSAYVKDIIHCAAMDSCKPVATPVDTQPKLGADTGPLYDDPSTFRSLAGALQYLTFTRPDISYAVQQICMHMHAPRGTPNLGLHLGPSDTGSLRAYTDADWAECPDTRCSTSGYCVYLGDNLISWSSKRQSTISRSSAEAEYRGVANVVAEICWLRNLLLELQRPLNRATIVYCDNVSAIYLSGNPVQHQRTKHIELDIHFVREQVQKGNVRVVHVSSRHQVADIFTKGLPRVLFDDFRSSLSIGPPFVSTAGE